MTDRATAADVVKRVLPQAGLDLCGRMAALLAALEGGPRSISELAAAATGINYAAARYALLVMEWGGLARPTGSRQPVGFELTAKGLGLLDAIRAEAGSTP